MRQALKLISANVTCNTGYTKFGLTAQLTCNASSPTATTGVWTGISCTGKYQYNKEF